MKTKRILHLAPVVFLAAAGSLAWAQTEETKSEVPSLKAFHDIIYPIWHTAYPSKDYAALRSYVPQVDELAAKVYAAKLPGILRDKQAKWDVGLAVFRKSVEDYAAAAKGADDAALLDAAEVLHAKYEALVRLIRPVLPEVDAFHQLLYVVYHKYVPDKLYEQIHGATGGLVAKAEAISKASLPARLASKAEAFKAASAALLEAAKALEAAGKSHDHDGLLAGVEALHARYQALEQIFD
ncbi:MAG: hypothetical protein FJY82_05025 [Candidatus Aminicenantes bacterium]|nr:hypothetical protein [Candidatus Aminicenantes bacterium]